MKYLTMAVVMVMVASVAFGATFEVKDGKAVITETSLGQPVPMQGQDGKTFNVPGAKRNITTTFEITKEEAQMQIIQLTQQRLKVTAQLNEMIKNIDANIKMLKDIDTALPEVKVDEVKPAE
jgi:hypothetical protein